MFRKDFIWGAASSAYQTEGGDETDGRGKCIWDTFTEQGKIQGNDNACISCDAFHRYRGDFALMKKLGIRNYRFSVSWARILPDGTGKVNEKGIAFYRDFLISMRENGIRPFLTLYHWELPQALQDKGGWLNPKSVDWFANFAKVAAENFSDLCSDFITMNEPQCFTGLGYLSGVHAPGLKLPVPDTFRLVHNALMANGKAVQMLRQYAKQPLRIGYAPTCSAALPDTDKPEDIEAARQTYFGFSAMKARGGIRSWTWNVSWYSDPVILGGYPEEGLKLFSRYLPKFTDKDMDLIHQKLDFYGQNIYNGYPVRMGANGKPEPAERKSGYPRNAAGWPVTPEALYWGPKFLWERYQLPLYITESGTCCTTDKIFLDGKVHDPDRIDFLHRYLLNLRRAAEEGADIRGFFHWCFTDNFEWNEGFSKRFGIVYVDYETQKRTPKDSALWYCDVMKSNGNKL